MKAGKAAIIYFCIRTEDSYGALPLLRDLGQVTELSWGSFFSCKMVHNVPGRHCFKIWYMVSITNTSGLYPFWLCIPWEDGLCQTPYLSFGGLRHAAISNVTTVFSPTWEAALGGRGSAWGSQGFLSAEGTSQSRRASNTETWTWAREHGCTWSWSNQLLKDSSNKAQSVSS